MTDKPATVNKLKRLYINEKDLGRAPWTSWGAKRLIDKHNNAMAFNLRLSQLLKSHKEDLLNGRVPWTIQGTTKRAKLDKIETAIGVAIALTGAGLALAGKDTALSGMLTAGGSGFAAGKVTSTLERLRHSPEHAALAFVAPAKLDGNDRDNHATLIDQAVESLASSNEQHKIQIAALRGYLAAKREHQEKIDAVKSEKRERSKERKRQAEAEARLRKAQRRARGISLRGS